MVHFDVDIAPEEPERKWEPKIRKLAEDHLCQVRRIRWIGPAGGNPQLFVDSVNRYFARRFVAALYGVNLEHKVDVASYVEPVLQHVRAGMWKESDLPAEGPRAD